MTNSMCINVVNKRYEDDRVYIRPMTLNDTEKIIDWRNAKCVMDNYIYRIPLTKEVHENWVETKVKTGEVVQYIIGYKDDNKEVGSVYISHIDNKNKTGEFGIFIGNEDYLSKGIGTRAQMLIEKCAFNDLGLKELTLRVLINNENAIKTYSNNGYESIGIEETTIETVDGKSKEKIMFMKKHLGD